MKQDQDSLTIIFSNNMSSIAMTKNPIFHNRTKHIELKFHFIREKVEKRKKEIEFEFCKTKHQN